MDTGNTLYGRGNMSYTSSTSEDNGVSKILTQYTGTSSRGPFSAYASANESDSESAYPYQRARSVSPVRRQITGGSGYAASRAGANPVRSHLTGGSVKSQFTGGGGGGFPAAAPLVPQVTGGGLPITHAMRPHSVIGNRSAVKTHWTGSSTGSANEGPGVAPLIPQTTGGLFVTRPRPKSVLGSRGLGSSHRGIELVRQATGGEWKS